MQKHASRRAKEEEGYKTLYEPISPTSEAPVFRDRDIMYLPITKEFSKQHFHDRYEIGLCYEGEGLFLSEESVASVSAGDAVFFAPGKRHYSRSINQNAPCRFRFAYLNPDHIRATLLTLNSDATEQILETAKHIPMVLRGEEARELREAFAERTAYTDASTVLHVCAFLLEAVQKSTQSPPKVPPRTSVAIALAEHLSVNYAKNESAEELSARFHLSESQLRRKFVAAYGMPPIAYRNTLRSRIGAELLLRTDCSVGEISEQLGFSSPSEFYRCFHKLYGCPPSDIRKKTKHP